MLYICIRNNKQNNNKMSTLNLNTVAKAVKNERVIKALEVLKSAEINRVSTEKAMAKRFRAVLNATVPVWNPEYEVEAGTKLTWDNAYLLTDECFNDMLERKHKIIVACGYELEFGYCPILIAEHKVREAHHTIIELYTELVDSCFKNIYANMDNLNQFKNLMIKVAFSHKSWK